MTRTAPAVAAALLLVSAAACHRREGEGTSITINGDDGSTRASMDGGTGAVKLDVPGFKGQVTLPKIQLDADDFDMNGVHLYPGSTIGGLDVQGGEESGGGVRVSFRSPAGADAVRGWLGERLGKAGYTLRDDGRALTGTTDEGKPFRLEVRPEGADRSTGTIVVGR